MKSKLFLSALIIVGATTVACKKTQVVGSGGTGGTTSSTTGASTGTKGTSNTTSTGSKTTTSVTGGTTTGGGAACDSIGVCQDMGMPPQASKGCFDCVLTQGTAFSDEGSCISAATAAYGTDGKCAMGGVQGACDFVACENKCFMNDPMGMMQASWDCFCTNNKMGASSKCLTPLTMQTDMNTCLGKIAANMPALMAEGAFENCWSKACTASCPQSGG